MRFAHESTGGPSKHGRANRKGLECDKMSVEAVTTQWNNYAARMIDTLSAINVKPDGVIMDSHEAGGSRIGLRDLNKNSCVVRGMIFFHIYLP